MGKGGVREVQGGKGEGRVGKGREKLAPKVFAWPCPC